MTDATGTAPRSEWRCAFHKAIVIGCTTRVLVLLAGYLAVVTFGFSGGRAPFRIADSELWNLPARWDTRWYLQIARTGYKWDPARVARRRQQNVAFFPAYPMFLRGATWATGGRGDLLGAVLLFASLITFVVALAYVYVLARDRLDESTATASLWLLATYPFAFFFSAAYTEPLFLLLAAGAFYHLEHDQVVPPVVFGLIAGLTRPNGGVLAASLLCVVVTRQGSIAGLLNGSPTSRRAMVRLAAALMPLAGTAMYSGYLYTLTGNPFAWMTANQAWGRHFGSLVTAIEWRVAVLASKGVGDYLTRLPIDPLDIAAALLGIAAIPPLYRRWGLPYASLVGLNVLLPFSTGILSIGRFTSVLFPVFFWLAEDLPRKFRPVLLVVFVTIQVVSGSLFFTWHGLF